MLIFRTSIPALPSVRPLSKRLRKWKRPKKLGSMHVGDNREGAKSNKDGSLQIGMRM